MNLYIILKGILVGLAVSIPLGPIGVLCIQRTLNKGYLSGLISGVGASTADIIYAVIAGFGITFVSDILIEQQSIIRVIGGAFLVFIGVKIYISNPIKQIRDQRTKGKRYFTDFITSFFVTISNPITILAFGVIFSSFQMINKSSGTIEITVIIVSVFSGAILWWISLISIISLFKKKIRLRNLFWINKITGVLIVLFAVFVIISAFFPSTYSGENGISQLFKH